MKGHFANAGVRLEPREGVDFEYDWEYDKARWLSLHRKSVMTPTYTGTNKGEDADVYDDDRDPGYG
jgi:hypothetical protein